MSPKSYNEELSKIAAKRPYASRLKSIAPLRASRAEQSTAAIAILVSACVLLSSCGGREAHPIASTNPADSVFDCAGINREYEANERQILSTVKEKGDAEGKNVVLGVTGVLLFWPALFFMDPKSPERVEIDALRNRNKVLEEVAVAKRCSPPKSKLTEVYKRLGAPASTPSKSR